MYASNVRFNEIPKQFAVFILNPTLNQCKAFLGRFFRGTQRPNVSPEYARNVSDGFLYALEACLVNLDVLGELWSSRIGGFFV